MANKKNDFYWNNYIEAADTACRAADYLLACVQNFDIGQIMEMLTKMHEFEHKGDSLRHGMTEALAKSFVTPIDREDMAELCQKLDHVIDSIEEVLQALYINMLFCGIFLPIAVKLGFRGEKLIAILVMLGSATTGSCSLLVA